MFFLKLFDDSYLVRTLSFEESVTFLIISVILILVLFWYYDKIPSNGNESNNKLVDKPIYKYKDILLQENSSKLGRSFPMNDKVSFFVKIILILLILRLIYVPFTYFLGDFSFYWY